MADLVQTAANVAMGSNAQYDVGTSGEALTAGNSVYLKASDNRWWKAIASGTAEQSGNGGCGIALDSTPGAGQPVVVFKGGTINLGATLTLGQTYTVSENAAGAIAPITDLGSGDRCTILGIATTTAILTTPTGGPFAPGIAKA